MDERDLLRRDVCDLIDEAAADCTRTVSQSLLQLASSPKAHSCVQGVVERRFHPLHVRDFYSVINILLLQLFLIRRQRNPTELQNNGSSDSEARILILERELKESKKRYKELFKINQQWAKDYAELSKQLGTTPTANASSGGTDTDSTADLPGPTSCSQCVQYSLELDTKTTLLKDLGLNYNKMKLIQSGLETRLEESEKERKKMADEYKAITLQIQELGGASMILRYREERVELIDEIRRLREKVSTVERERASLQTHLNRFKYSLRDLMADTDWRGNHGNGYATTSSTHLYSNGTSHSKVPQVFTDSNGYSTGVRNGVSRMGRRNERGCVNPQQFAPLRNINPLTNLPTTDFNKDGLSPQTPPGYLSRGDPFEDIEDSSEQAEQNVNCPNYLKIPLATQSESTSNELPSPLTVPRPLSAPGSLFESTPPPNNKTTPTTQTYSPSDGEVTMINGLLNTQTYTRTQSPRNYLHSSNPSIVYTSPLPNGGSPSSTINQYVSGNFYKCPQCGIKFVQNEQNYDLWFDHVAKCTR